MSTPTVFLEKLARDDERRALLVAELRCAASLLEGSEPEASYARDIQVQAGFTIACRLRDLAANLCDHARLEPDGRCRYCRARVR